MFRQTPYQPPDIAAIFELAADLAGQPSHIAAPLRRQLRQVADAARAKSPDLARRVKRLLDAVEFILQSTERADERLLRTREFARALLTMRVAV